MKTMTIRFDAAQHATIKTLSQHQRRSFSQQVHFLIDEGLRIHTKGNDTTAPPKTSKPVAINDASDEIVFDEE